ncbi:MAG: hypothetical protein ACLR78_06035 [Roseburia sp.]
MDPEHGMQTGWVLLNGVWYYFNPISDGKRGIMYAGQRTPDGYYVDKNGVWGRKKQAVKRVSAEPPWRLVRILVREATYSCQNHCVGKKSAKIKFVRRFGER